MEPRSPRLARWFAALASPNEAERGDAAESPPDEATDEEVAAGLVPLLCDRSEVVRLCAAETLGRVPGARTVAALRAFVARETDPLARAYGLSSLGIVGTSEDLATLLPETADDRPPHVRIHALVGLYELVRRGVTRSLLALLRHEAPEARVAAAEALAAVLEPRDDDDAMHLLAQCADREAIEARRDDILAVIDRLQVRARRSPDEQA